MKPTHKPVCSCENGEYSAMALGFTSGFDQKMSEPWVIISHYMIYCLTKSFYFLQIVSTNPIDLFLKALSQRLLLIFSRWLIKDKTTKMVHMWEQSFQTLGSSTT